MASKKTPLPKASNRDLENHLAELDVQARNIVMALEGMQGKPKESMVELADRLGLSEEEVKKVHKGAMFKLRMAFGRARKS